MFNTKGRLLRIPNFLFPTSKKCLTLKYGNGGCTVCTVIVLESRIDGARVTVTRTESCAQCGGVSGWGTGRAGRPRALERGFAHSSSQTVKHPFRPRVDRGGPIRFARIRRGLTKRRRGKKCQDNAKRQGCKARGTRKYRGRMEKTQIPPNIIIKYFNKYNISYNHNN